MLYILFKNLFTRKCNTFYFIVYFSENAFMDNAPHWYPLCEHDEKQGMELPVPTVLPPKCNNSHANSNGGRLAKHNNSSMTNKPMNGSPVRLADGPSTQLASVRPKARHDKYATNVIKPRLEEHSIHVVRKFSLHHMRTVWLQISLNICRLSDQGHHCLLISHPVLFNWQVMLLVRH